MHAPFKLRRNILPLGLNGGFFEERSDLDNQCIDSKHHQPKNRQHDPAHHHTEGMAKLHPHIFDTLKPRGQFHTLKLADPLDKHYLNQGIDKWCQNGGLGEDQKEGEEYQNNENRGQPPLFAHTEKPPEFGENRELTVIGHRGAEVA